MEILAPKEQSILDRRGRKNKKLASSNRLSKTLNKQHKIRKFSKSKDKKIWKFRDSGKNCSDN
jgi:hypothetical protein